MYAFCIKRGYPLFILVLFIVLSFPSVGPFAQEVANKELEQLDFAHGLAEKGLVDMAVAEYRKFIEQYPNSEYIQEATFAIGETYFFAKAYPEAITAFEHFKGLGPNPERLAKTALRLGQIYFQQEKYDDVIRELTAVNTEGISLDLLQSIYFYFGKSYRKKNETLQAIGYFQKAVGVEGVATYKAYAYQEMAEMEIERQQPLKAIELYSKAVESAPDNELKAGLLFKLGESQYQSGNYAESVKAFDEILKKYPDNDVARDALINAMLAFYNLKQYDNALAEYVNNTKIIKEEKAFVDVFFALSMVYLELSKYDQAIVTVEKVLKFKDLEDADREKLILKKAEMLIRGKEFQEGISWLEEQFKTDPQNIDQLLFLKAQANFGLKNFEKSLELFQKVKTEFPNSHLAVSALRGIAQSSYALGNDAQARELFLECFNAEMKEDLRSEDLYNAILLGEKLNVNTPTIENAENYLITFPAGAYYEQVALILVKLYSNAQQFEKSISLLNGLSAKDNVQDRELVNFLMAYNLQLAGRLEESLQWYEKVSTGKEDQKYHATAIKNSALVYLSQNNNEKTAELFDRLITETGAKDIDLKTFFWLCDEYLKQKKFNDVLRIAEKAESLYPGQGQSEIAYLKAEAYRELKDMDNAIKFFDTVVSSGKDSVYIGAAHIGKGLLLSEKKDYKQSEDEFQKAITENPDDHTITMRARFEIGNLKKEKGELEEALKFYLLVTTLYDDDLYCPKALFLSGEVFEALNQKQEALNAYQEIVTKYPQNSLAEDAKKKVQAINEI